MTNKSFYEVDNLTKYLIVRIVELNYLMGGDRTISQYESWFIIREEMIKALRESEYDIDGFISIMKKARIWY